ncbi:unknow [Vibrio parahaemolyticus]|nr:unknow [Vibrio parahaemolyticus]
MIASRCAFHTFSISQNDVDVWNGQQSFTITGGRAELHFVQGQVESRVIK